MSDTSLVVTLPTDELREAVRAVVPDDVRLEVWPMEGPSGLGRIDLAVLPYMGPASLLAVLENEEVAAVQSQALGYDNADRYLPTGVSLSNAVGVHEGSTAEITLALVLAAQRDLHLYLAEQQSGSWVQRFSPGLQGLTALVVGVGGVGSAIRERLVPFEVEVVRSASRAREDEHGPIHGPEDLPELVGRADIVILATPLTEQTHHLFDAQMIARMKQDALLVNIGRGPLVDTDALVAAVRDGRIRTALDVMDPEPLPADHPLWNLPGVLITPHVGGRSNSMQSRVVELVRAQVERLRAGEPLEHRVL
ncbi:NAD(P)-dependent oxidoreductase [Luteococcus sp. Sow4_B9]|uniref:NAD(P)-dependent oxidoreductase n=1 Tax=Luteococcus sp. Sow4_B9 TaxID=3438792 RepID=UPI003F977000